MLTLDNERALSKDIDFRIYVSFYIDYLCYFEPLQTFHVKFKIVILHMQTIIYITYIIDIIILPDSSQIDHRKAARVLNPTE